MNNERYQEIINEAYGNYKKNTHDKNEKNGNWGRYSRWGDNPLIAGVQHLTKSSFIQMCKADIEFSEKWGLKIEERELNYNERFRIAYKNIDLRKKLESETKMLHYPDGHNKVMDDAKIPTKLISVTYKGENIESYE